MPVDDDSKQVRPGAAFGIPEGAMGEEVVDAVFGQAGIDPELLPYLEAAGAPDLAEGEGLVDEEAGQAHGDSRVVATGAQFTACRGALEPAPSGRRGGDVQPGSRWSGWKSLTATLTASRVAMSMPSLATSARKSICSGVIT